MMLWTPEMADNVNNDKAVSRVVNKYYGDCMVEDGINPRAECIAELRAIGEDWLANNFDRFTFGDG